MKRFSDEKIIGIVGTVLAHAVLGLLLYFLVLDTPPTPPEKGVEVMMGVDIEDGTVDQPVAAPKPVVNTTPPPARPVAQAPEEPVLTQDIEESVALPTEEPKKKPKKEKPQETEKPKKPEKTAEQIQKEKEEAERKERERIEKETRKNVENSIANAFNKGSKMDKVQGAENKEASTGSPDGNSNAGQKSGVGIGFDLEGRQPGRDGIIIPKEKLQAEGRVVVDITVNPAGKVIVASINLQKTNTTDLKLREAALKAARSTTFNSIDGPNNQHGTITYNFKLTK